MVIEYDKSISSSVAQKQILIRKSSTLPGDVARANGHTILGDFLEDVNER